MNRLFVALADIDQVLGQFVRLRMAMLQVIREISAFAAQPIGILIQGFEQTQDLR